MPSLLSQIDKPADLKKLSEDDLHPLAEEVRRELINVVTQRGGHLGSNLGVVELTIALHYVYDFENDVAVWDVSNQTYTHKLLTGRRGRFHTLRQFKGISGFANREESKYDPFTFGHAGTALSTALGILCGDDIASRDRKVIAVIGDGAMTCGVSYEALNNCGALKKNMLVVLNDNTMSISRTVGALSKYLNNIRTVPIYDEFKQDLHSMLNKLPLVGHPIEEVLESIRRSIKATIGNNLFSALGFQYYGPIDGHDIKLLIKTLRNIKRQQRPVLLHILTQKGKGHPDADSDPQALHGISPKKHRESKIEAVPPPRATYTKVFANAMVKLGESERKLAAITAAMPDGTGLIEFEKRHPQRYFDVGICEQHAVALSAGLAYAGLRPVVAIYSTFLQRAYDQVFHEVCLQNLPVIFAMDRAGIAGSDGPTHNGTFDIAYLRTLPNIVLMAPRDGEELEEMLSFAAKLDKASGIRYPRAAVPDLSAYSSARTPIQLGKAEVLETGVDGALLAYGSMVEHALKAAEVLSKEGIRLCVVNARFAKPVDRQMISQLLAEQPFVVTLEEHVLSGGFGSAVVEAALEMKLEAGKIATLALPDNYIEQGERDELFKLHNIDVDGIVRAIRALRESPAKRHDKVRISHED